MDVRGLKTTTIITLSHLKNPVVQETKNRYCSYGQIAAPRSHLPTLNEPSFLLSHYLSHFLLQIHAVTLVNHNDFPLVKNSR